MVARRSIREMVQTPVAFLAKHLNVFQRFVAEVFVMQVVNMHHACLRLASLALTPTFRKNAHAKRFPLGRIHVHEVVGVQSTFRFRLALRSFFSFVLARHKRPRVSASFKHACAANLSSEGAFRSVDSLAATSALAALQPPDLLRVHDTRQGALTPPLRVVMAPERAQRDLSSRSRNELMFSCVTEPGPSRAAMFRAFAHDSAFPLLPQSGVSPDEPRAWLTHLKNSPLKATTPLAGVLSGFLRHLDISPRSLGSSLTVPRVPVRPFLRLQLFLSDMPLIGMLQTSWLKTVQMSNGKLKGRTA